MALVYYFTVYSKAAKQFTFRFCKGIGPLTDILRFAIFAQHYFPTFDVFTRSVATNSMSYFNC